MHLCQLPRNDRMADDAATKRAIREVPATYPPEGLTMLVEAPNAGSTAK